MTKPSKETLLKNAETLVNRGFNQTGLIDCDNSGIECEDCILDSDSNCHDMKYLKRYINKHKGEQNMNTDENGIVKIDPKQCKRMLVWDAKENRADDRHVIALINNRYLCVTHASSESFVNGGDYKTVIYSHAKPIPETKEMSISEAIKQLEEINGCKVKIVEGGE